MRNTPPFFPVITILILFASSGVSWAQDDKIDKSVKRSELPVPDEQDQLFYLQRDPDANTVVYVLNKESGVLDQKNPVKAYWIRYTDGGKRQPLTLLQETMAYGVQTNKQDEGYVVRIKAYKPLTIHLTKDTKTDQYIARVKIEDQFVRLQSIFVRIDGGSFFSPNIEFVEINGLTPDGEKITHRFEI